MFSLAVLSFGRWKTSSKQFAPTTVLILCSTERQNLEIKNADMHKLYAGGANNRTISAVANREMVTYSSW
jgi:hypothetical protein